MDKVGGNDVAIKSFHTWDSRGWRQWADALGFGIFSVYFEMGPCFLSFLRVTVAKRVKRFKMMILSYGSLIVFN